MDNGQAHGLCFSVKPDVEIPPSLVNIYKELHDDCGCYIPNNGYLEKWAREGVMLAEYGTHCPCSSGQFASEASAGKNLPMRLSGCSMSRTDLSYLCSGEDRHR